jgi:hypothetical protein
MKTIIVSTPATQSNFFNTFSFPVAKRITVSSNLVQVIPMSYRYVITYRIKYRIKYSDNVFFKSEETEGVHQISLNNDYKLEDVLKIMNENKSRYEIEKMIEDKNLREEIINILRIIKIKNIIKQTNENITK